MEEAAVRKAAGKGPWLFRRGHCLFALGVRSIQVWFRMAVTSQMPTKRQDDADDVSRVTDWVTGNHGLGFRVWGLPSARPWG